MRAEGKIRYLASLKFAGGGIMRYFPESLVLFSMAARGYNSRRLLFR
jgi:hypothetical protein